MLDLGTLSLAVKVNLQEAINDLNELKETTEKTSNSLGTKLKGGLTSVAKASAVAVGATVAVGTAVMKSAEAFSENADEIDKMSLRLGMSREAYQEWDYVLSQSGVDINSLQTGLKTLTNKVEDAKNGVGGAKELFEALGITLEDLETLSREEIFAKVTEGLQGMEDSAYRAGLANDLFGKSGLNLTPLFNETAESTENLKNKAHELGMVLGDEAIDAGVEFTDNMDTMKRSISSIGSEVMMSLMPTINKLLSWIISNLPSIRRKVSELVDKLKPVLNWIANFIKNTLIPAIQNIWNKLQPIVSKIATYIPLVINFLVPIIETILDVVSAVFEGIEWVWNNVLKPVIDLLKEAWDDVSPYVSGLIEAIGTAWDTMCGAFDYVWQNILKPIGNGFKSAWDSVKSGIGAVWDSIKEKFQTFCEGIQSFYESYIAPVIEGLNGFISKLAEAQTAQGNFYRDKAISNALAPYGYDGSKRNGMREVPFDGYIAELHRGEMVLTAEEANRYQSHYNSLGDSTQYVTVNNYSPQALDEATTARLYRQSQRKLLLGF